MDCWMNGVYQKCNELQISPFDHGFLYGVGFFETFRTYDGRVLQFEAHMRRLGEALAEFRIDFPYTADEVLTVIRELDARAGGQDGYFRINVSAGVHDIGLAPSQYRTPNVIVFRKALAAVARGTEKHAVWLTTLRNQPESRLRHKSHNYLNNVRARLELPSLKEHEGLFVTEDGYVAEGITSNVFWIKDETLFTPSLETGILSGTTRSFVMELARKEGLCIMEGLYSKEDIESAEEVFITNAVQEIVPIAAIESISYAGATGVYYQRLHQLYVDAVNDLKEGE